MTLVDILDCRPFDGAQGDIVLLLLHAKGEVQFKGRDTKQALAQRILNIVKEVLEK